MIEDKVNINGEFLGISSLAIYSAPWFLQFILLMLVVVLFVVKVSRDSSELKKLSEAQNNDELENFLANVNQVFFGFAVPTKNLAAYWVGFLIYIITLSFAIYNTYVHIFV